MVILQHSAVAANSASLLHLPTLYLAFPHSGSPSHIEETIIFWW